MGETTGTGRNGKMNIDSKLVRELADLLNDTGLTERPSEIFRRQCYISFEPVEKSLPLLADFIGRDNILWATDYPHADGFTDAPGLIRNLGMPKDLYDHLMVIGARRYYRL